MKRLINDPTTWQKYAPGHFIDKSETHIFKISINVYEHIKKKYSHILSQTEMQKASRFKQLDDAKRYVLGKFFVRTILSDLLNIPAQDIFFSTLQNKKPYVVGHHFNISHSGNFTIIALSPYPIGVDIELIKSNFDFSVYSVEFFNDSESQNIKNIVDFYTFWTRKEAILKASGEGLIDNLHDIDSSKNSVIRNSMNLILFSMFVDPQHIMSIAKNFSCNKTQYWSF